MSFRPTRILVVDDSDLDVEKVERSLGNLQIRFNCVRARDGEEALETIRTWPAVHGGMPSLILLDINMPRMNGLELLTALRAQVPTFNVPIFMTTTSSLPTDISRAFQHDICGYIVKPLSITESLKLMTTAEQFWQRIDDLAGRGNSEVCVA